MSAEKYEQFDNIQDASQGTIVSINIYFFKLLYHITVKFRFWTKIEIGFYWGEIINQL